MCTRQIQCRYLGGCQDAVINVWIRSIRTCQGCGQPIAAERLEVFPDATHCTACAAAGIQGGDDEREFCPRCGGLMVTRQSTAGGITRYVMSCSDCGA